MSTHDPHEINAAVQRLVRSGDIEVLPLKGADDQLTTVPAETTVTITCSPKLGIDRTLEHTARAVRNGYRVVPHIAARQVSDEAELHRILDRLAQLGVSDLYVIGGDAEEPAGRFSEAGQLLEAMAKVDHSITSIGVACYPEGHPKISDPALSDALRRKARYADYMVSQLCFDASALSAWLGTARSRGVTLPLHVGLAAPMSTRKLAELSLKIGVGPSLRYLTKQHGMVGNLLLGNRYQPETLLHALGDDLLSEEADIAAVHLFSFNQLDETVAWQQRIGSADRIERQSA